MPQIVSTVNYNVNTIAGSGGTLSIPVQDPNIQYLIYGTLVPTSSLTINADTTTQVPVNGMTYEIEYNANVSLTSGINFTIFGYSLTPEQALTYGRIISIYDNIAATWHTQYFPDFTRGTNFISGDQLESGITIIPAPASIPGTALEATVAGDGLSQNISGALDVNVDGVTLQITTDTLRVKTNSIDENYLTTSVAGNGLTGGNGSALGVNVDNTTIEINTDTLRVKDAGISNAKLTPGANNTVKITNNSGIVTDLALASNQVLGNTGSGIGAVGLGALVSGVYETVSIPVSFEANEQGASYIYIPYNCYVVNIGTTVIKDLTGTDDGILSISTRVSSTIIDTVTVPASTTAGNFIAHTAIGFPFATFGGSSATLSRMEINSSKVTPGGKVLVTIVLQRI